MNEFLYETVTEFLSDHEKVLALHAAIMERLGDSVNLRDYERVAEDVFYNRSIPVPMGTPRYELRQAMWMMFIEGKFS